MTDVDIDIESEEGAQQKADQAQSNAESFATSEVDSHNTSTAVHGVGEVFDAGNYDPEGDTHSRYTAEEAREAIENGELSRIDGVDNHRIRFDSDSSYIEVVDQSNTRSDMVTADTFVDDGIGWLSDAVDADGAAAAAPVQSVNGEEGDVEAVSEDRVSEIARKHSEGFAPGYLG